MDEAYNNFYNNLLPGNYALTKSMELTKKNTSGTLWYTKKFLVLYYYIFLSNDIDTRLYITKAIEAFDKYIEDLDASVKNDAYKFFYPQNDTISLKSLDFKTFTEFAGNHEFDNPEQRISHIEMAKKYYFALLMESGGQSGVKKRIKEAMYAKDFVFSYEALREIIDDYYENRLNINYNGIINDYMAFIRNERQILYYYGYFHSKTTGAADREFSSLTPIGELALEANSREFQCIWEHQKFKMISQPVTVEIGNVPNCGLDLNKFCLNFNPYLEIINSLTRNRSLTLEQYQYIVSRKTRLSNQDEWIEEEEKILSKLPEIVHKVKSFGRRGDIETHDARKEVLKYILGLRDDLVKDNKTNIIGCCRMGNQGIKVTSVDILRKLAFIYQSLNLYKQGKYNDLFILCEEELRKKYIASANGDDYSLNPQVKINWDLYNIRPDKPILLGIIIAMTTIEFDIELSAKNAEDIAQIAYENYRNLLVKMGLRRIKSVIIAFRNLISSILTNDYENFLIDDEYEQIEARATYLEISTTDLFTKIQQTSNSADTYYTADRKRNTALIDQMKSYYIQRFATKLLLKCECCQEETFITYNNEPYVEFHHLIPFGGGHNGPDHYLNIFALCPSCHRKIHHMRVDEKDGYYRNLSENNYLQLDFVARLKELYKHRMLRSYQLEFLLADHTITQNEYNVITA